MPMSSRSVSRAALLAAAAAISATMATAHAGASTGSPAPAGQTQRPSASVVRIPFPQDDGSLTPYTFDLGYSLMTLVYDTVMWRDANGVPRPWLADSVTTSADGLTLTIHVASGATWQDGPPVTSADIAFTFVYVATHPHSRFTPEVADIRSIDTPDPAIAVVHLGQPSPGFDEEPLSDVPILPQHLWANLPADARAPSGMPVGSGPYRMVSHAEGKAYRFQAVDGYVRGKPAVRRIEVPIIHDQASTIKALENRSVDALPFSLSSGDVAPLARDVGVRMETGDLYDGTVLMMNTRQAPFGRSDVRRAVSEALNLPQIAADVGLAVPAGHGYLHPDSGWAAAADVQQYNPAKAHAVLGGVGAAVTVLAPDNSGVEQEAGHQVVQALQRAGLNARLGVVPVPTLEAAIGLAGQKPSYALAIWDLPALASYDPALLGRLFGSGQPLNLTGYTNPTFDVDAGRIDASLDPGARRAAVQQAVDLLASDAPVVPLYFPKGEFAVRPAVYDGWVYVKGSGILDKLAFVDPAPSRPGDLAAGPTTGSVGGTGAPLLAIAAALALAAVALAGYGAFRWLGKA